MNRIELVRTIGERHTKWINLDGLDRQEAPFARQSTP
jgi:hypothetical protein